jgi:hypothetical protein
LLPGIVFMVSMWLLADVAAGTGSVSAKAWKWFGHGIEELDGLR